MGVLWWLAIPLVASVVAMVWVSRRNRAATPEEQQHGIEEMARFREAMSKPLPPRER